MPGIPRARIDALLERAIRAPSSHNTQPWLFEIDGNRVRLHADRRRALPVNDPDDRELTLSCGAALMTLRVAAAADGLGTEVAVLPDADDPDLLATLTLEPGTEPDAALAALAPEIERRRTYRKRFAETAVGAESVAALASAAAQEDVRLETVEGDAARNRLAGLVSEGDQAQWADRSWRRELAAWMHPRRDGDGLSMPGLVVPVAQAVVRSFDMGGGVAARDSEIAEHSPLLAVLGTQTDEPRDWIVAGQGLQRVLLAASRDGLQASYLNQPVQVAHLRHKLQSLVPGAGVPQVLLRLGAPEEDLPPAPRRPVEEVEIGA